MYVTTVQVKQKMLYGIGAERVIISQFKAPKIISIQDEDSLQYSAMQDLVSAR